MAVAAVLTGPLRDAVERTDRLNRLLIGLIVGLIVGGLVFGTLAVGLLLTTRNAINTIEANSRRNRPLIDKIDNVSTRLDDCLTPTPTSGPAHACYEQSQRRNGEINKAISTIIGDLESIKREVGAP